jgi:hypothetical protein
MPALRATPVDGNRWAASPASRIRPSRYRSACRAWKVKRDSRSTSATGKLTPSTRATLSWNSGRVMGMSSSYSVVSSSVV